MTDKEKAIVMAYTGVCMLSGDKFKIFHEYVENIMGRPVYTHEIAITAVVDEIKKNAKADFIALCAEQEPKTGHWIEKDDNLYECSECGQYIYSETEYDLLEFHAFCGRCGAKMIEPQERSGKE